MTLLAVDLPLLPPLNSEPARRQRFDCMTGQLAPSYCT